MAAADTPHLADDREGGRPDRRAVIRGISAMGLAAFAVPFTAGSGGAAELAPDPKPKKKKKKKGATADLVKDGDTPLGSTADVPVNSGYLYEMDEYIVTQPKAGKFVGFDSLCTHEGCPVDIFSEPGKMSCGCHGAQFDLATGKPVAGPAKKPLPKKPIIVEGDKIFKAKKKK